MFKMTLSKPVPQPSVHIVDYALTLFLPLPEQQSVWRFDLDTLMEQAFCVTGRDGYYDLTLKALDGQDHVIARFLDKADAQHVLHLLHRALTGAAGRRSGCFAARCFGWLTFWRGVFLAILLGIVWYMLQPAPRIAPPVNQTSSAPANAPTAAPAPGDMLDADQLIQ